MLVISASALSVYKYEFIAALFVAECLMFARVVRHKHIRLRFFINLTAHFLIAFLYPISSYNAMSSSLMFACFFVCSVLINKYCYSLKLTSSLFCAVAAYTMQHIASVLYNVIMTLGAFNRSMSVYSGTPATFSFLTIAVFIEVYALVYFLCHMFFIKGVKKGDEIGITRPSLLGLIGLMMLVEILINAIIVYRLYENPDRLYLICFSSTNIICSMCILIVMFGQLLRRSLENELEVVSELRRQEKRQYEISRETIDMINIKCHDMKHQIHEIRHSGAITNAALKEVENSIEIYDSIVKTGSEALDVILAEKSLFCRKNGITINCIVDGGSLSFMSETDVYSLFGNLLDNAIRSVMNLYEDARVISLNVKPKGRLLTINCNNPYAGELIMDKGLPKTTSEDKKVHGFGVRSMILTVEKYGGTISFKPENGVFNVNILFTVPVNAKGSEAR